MLAWVKGRMNGIFRLRLPKLFILSPQLLFPLCNFFNKLPQNSCLGYHLDFLLFKAVCSQFSSVIQTWEIFFLLITIQELCYVFVFLGFLILLANFGLVAPIPDGIRVLGVETPLRT